VSRSLSLPSTTLHPSNPSMSPAPSSSMNDLRWRGEAPPAAAHSGEPAPAAEKTTQVSAPDENASTPESLRRDRYATGACGGEGPGGIGESGAG
jgi:hypothetical protein